MSGWIKLHRQIQGHWLWLSEKPFDKRSAWIDILLMVNHEDKTVLLGNDLVEVKRGERLTSELKLAERWGWSRTKVRNFLNLLEKEGMIENKKECRKRTRLKVLNYSIYQGSEDSEKTSKKQVKNNERTSREQAENINKNDKNDKNDKKLVIDLSFRELLNQLKQIDNYPFDTEKDTEFINSLMIDFPTLDIKEELKKWATYKLDKPLTKKSNPRSQFRNWCKKSAEWKTKSEPQINPFREKAYQSLMEAF